MAREKSTKFPPSPEIKRVLSAVQKVGVEIAAIEIEPNQIRIFSLEAVGQEVPQVSAFDQWKATQAKKDKI